MNLEGMKFNFLGDSITEYYCASVPENAYHQVMMRKYGLAKAMNYGVGGTRIARQNVPSEITIYDYTFEMRADIMDRDVDAVVVFGGTNDYGHGDAKFGSVDDECVNTYCGAINSLITKLKKDFAHAEIIFMTPLHRLNDTDPHAPDNKTLEDYVNAMLEICKNRGVKVIDLFGLDKMDPADVNLFEDGLHPTDEGHAVLGEIVAQELMKL